MTDTCPWCGEPDGGGSACSRCGGTLLIDVAVEPIADERVRFQVAKALATIGAPLGSFPALQKALHSEQQVVARHASVAVLRRVNEVLQPFGLAAQALRPAPQPRRAPWVAGLVVVALFAAVALAVPVMIRAVALALPQLSSPGTPVAATLLPASLDKKAVLASVVQLKCGNQLGAGFFIEPDAVLTNAHVVCSDDVAVKVSLSGGRTLLGRVERRDDWLDYAVVRVAGADEPTLALGDSTVLREGEPIAFVGSPLGMSFTWHEGRVSFVGRNQLGVSYVQLDARINPGNSGGPLINGGGQVVGIVSMKVTSAEGIGLALPIEYVDPPEGDALDRWNVQLAKVKALDDESGSEAAGELAAPVLLEVKPQRQGLVVTFLVRSEDVATRVNFELRRGRDVLCTDSMAIAQSVSFEQVLKDQRQNIAQRRELEWLLKRRAFRGVLGASGVITLARCPIDELQGDSQLVLVGGGEGRDRVTVTRAQLLELEASRRLRR